MKGRSNKSDRQIIALSCQYLADVKVYKVDMEEEYKKAKLFDEMLLIEGKGEFVELD